MTAGHVALAYRPVWDANRDQFYIDCYCGDCIWGDTADEAKEEFKAHQEDMA